MIEIVQSDLPGEKKASSVRRPNNIRQIGNPTGVLHIYLEDYVYTYLHQMPENQEQNLGILLGKNQMIEGENSLFISGAIGLSGEGPLNENVFFKEETWEQIYKTMKEYFEDLEVVGWYQIRLNEKLRITVEMERVQSKYFEGKNRVFFLADLMEKEEAFYLYEHSINTRENGYYIYYEKNPQMQEYMVTTRNQEDKVEAQMQNGEKLMQNYRALLREKQNHMPQAGGRSFIYILAGAFMLTLCILGVTMLNSAAQMRQVGTAISQMAERNSQETETVVDTSASTDKEQEQVQVESIEGGVEPETDAETASSDTAESDGDSEAKENTETDTDVEASTDTASADTASVEAEESASTDTANTDTASADTASTEAEGSASTDTASTEAEGSASADTANTDTASASTDTASADTEEVGDTALQQGYYVVQQGDSLESICLKLYSTTAVKNQICALNEIEDADKVYVGQKLVLP